MVGPDGLEPSTPRLSSACSNQLSYEPEIGESGDDLFQVQPIWWSRRDSNSRPSACKADALPTELRPRNWSAIAIKNFRFSIFTLYDQLEPGNLSFLRPSR